VQPALAIVQAGHRSSFGHPAPDVVARWQAQGATVLQTPRCGAVHWASERRAATCERDLSRRFWHYPDVTAAP